MTQARQQSAEKKIPKPHAHIMMTQMNIMMSCAIDAKENRYVQVTDIPGAFLHADMEE